MYIKTYSLEENLPLYEFSGENAQFVCRDKIDAHASSFNVWKQRD